MKTLLEDYQKKVRTINELIEANEKRPDVIERLEIKLGVYRAMIVDIERAIERCEENTPKPNYLVQPTLYAERKANYELGDKLNKVFFQISEKDVYAELEKKYPSESGSQFGIGFCGNISNNLVVNRKTMKAEYLESGYKSCYEYDGKVPTHAQLYQAISAPLFLYRLICLFGSPIVQSKGAGGYKVPWSLVVKHKSGTFIQFREWKGSVSIGMVEHEWKELTESCQNDILTLLSLIMSDESPHPYDNVTAGAVA